MSPMSVIVRLEMKHSAESQLWRDRDRPVCDRGQHTAAGELPLAGKLSGSLLLAAGATLPHTTHVHYSNPLMLYLKESQMSLLELINGP